MQIRRSSELIYILKTLHVHRVATINGHHVSRAVMPRCHGIGGVATPRCRGVVCVGVHREHVLLDISLAGENLSAFFARVPPLLQVNVLQVTTEVVTAIRTVTHRARHLYERRLHITDLLPKMSENEI